MSTRENASLSSRPAIGFFERYLTVWVFLCMVVGVAFGKFAPGVTADLSRLEFVQGSHDLTEVSDSGKNDLCGSPQAFRIAHQFIRGSKGA